MMFQAHSQLLFTCSPFRNSYASIPDRSLAFFFDRNAQFFKTLAHSVMRINVISIRKQLIPKHFLQIRYSSVISPKKAPQNDPEQSIGPPIHQDIFKSGQKFGSFRVGDSTFYTLIENFAKAGDLSSLENVFIQMKHERRVFIEGNFILAFKAYNKANQAEKALDLFHKMWEKRVSPNVLTYNLIVKVLCKLGWVDRAIETFREMPFKKCVPDVFTYCTLMDGLCKEDRIDEAVCLLDEMHVEGCLPTAATFNVLINGLCKKGDLARAAKVVENMFLKGCVPNEVTYNTLIHGLCLKGKLDKAVSLLDRMVSNKCIPNDVTYSTLVNGLVKQGRAVDGVSLLISMEKRGHKINEYVYSTLINGFFKERKPELALKIWKDMINKGLKPNIVLYGTLVDGLCREKKPDKAKDIITEMEKMGCKPNAFVYSSLMKGYFFTGNTDKALDVWKEVERNDYVRNEVCYSVVIDGLCSNGRLKEAIAVWENMLSKGHKPDVIAYSSMTHGLCNNGFVEEGLKLFNQMLCEGSGSKPDVVTYNIILNSLCNNGSVSRAIDILNRMLDHGCDPDLVTCNVFLKTLKEQGQDGSEFLDELVIRLHKQKRVVGACNIIEVMLQRYLVPKESTWEIVVQQEQCINGPKGRCYLRFCHNGLVLCCVVFFARVPFLQKLNPRVTTSQQQQPPKHFETSRFHKNTLSSPSHASTSPPVHRHNTSGLYAALSDDQLPSVRRKPAVTLSQSADTKVNSECFMSDLLCLASHVSDLFMVFQTNPSALNVLKRSKENKGTTPSPNSRDTRVSSSPSVGSKTKSYSNSYMASQHNCPNGDTDISFNIPRELGLLGKEAVQQRKTAQKIALQALREASAIETVVRSLKYD
ncbi:putative tetratricopeptide-like helical domain superfamily [Helianthus debilis subsp. tardiflorus]